MRIIGIDPGLARVGYGIIEIENERKILLDCGVIETGKDKKEEDRLYEIFQDLNELINHWNPTAAIAALLRQVKIKKKKIDFMRYSKGLTLD